LWNFKGSIEEMQSNVRAETVSRVFFPVGIMARRNIDVCTMVGVGDAYFV